MMAMASVRINSDTGRLRDHVGQLLGGRRLRAGLGRQGHHDRRRPQRRHGHARDDVHRAVAEGVHEERRPAARLARPRRRRDDGQRHPHRVVEHRHDHGLRDDAAVRAAPASSSRTTTCACSASASARRSTSRTRTPGILEPWQEWEGTEKYTVAYGQGVASSPIQLVVGRQHDRQRRHVRGAQARAVDGRRRRRGARHAAVGDARGASGPRSPTTMQQMMKRVVCEGTAKQARVPGLSIAGKTGTGFIAQDNGTLRPRRRHPGVLRQLRRVPARRGPAGDDPRVDRPAAGRQRRPLRRHGGGAGVPAAGADDDPRARHRAAARLDGLSGVTAVRPRGVRATATTLAALLAEVPAALGAAIDGDAVDGGDGDDPRLAPRRRPATCSRACAASTTTATASPPTPCAAGATALLVDHVVDVGRPVGQLVVADTRLAMGPVAAARLRAPEPRRCRVVGRHGDQRQDDDVRACWPPILGAAGRADDGHRHAVGRQDDAGGARAAGPAGRGPRRRRPGRRDGGVVARPRPAPRRRHPLRRRRVHQPRHRPPRPARHARGVLPGQGPAVHAGAGGGRREQRRRPPRAAAARRGADRDGAVLARRRQRRRRHRRPPRADVARRSACVVGARRRVQRRQHARRGDDGGRARHRRPTSSPPAWPPPTAVPGRFERVAAGARRRGRDRRASSTTPTRPTGWTRSSPRRARSPPGGSSSCSAPAATATTRSGRGWARSWPAAPTSPS